MKRVEWFAVDWGNSNLRIWCMDEHSNVVDSLFSSKGMLSLTPDQYVPTLIELLAPYLDASRQMPVLACGAIGSRQGLKEVPYRPIPCRPIEGAHTVSVSDKRISVEIVPGLSQNTPEGVMRGEESQIAGVLLHSGLDSQVICLPGTHSKWAKVRKGTVSEFRSAMTGELFHVLSTHSILRFSVESESFDLSSFDAGVALAKQSPETLTSELFTLRSQDLLNATSSSVLRSRLSGLLIGVEIAGMKDFFPDSGGCITVVGNKHLSSLYERALDAWGLSVRKVPSDVAVLEGLKHLKQDNDRLMRAHTV